MKTIQLHSDLPAEQVLNLLDMLETLHHALWEVYEPELLDLVTAHPADCWRYDTLEPPEAQFNDDIPF